MLYIVLALALALSPIISFSQTLEHPESILYDAAKSRYLISAVGEFNKQDGHIFTLKDGKISKFSQALLYDPKGFAIVENVIYINDIDRIVMIDANTGMFTNEAICPGASQLNDMVSDGYSSLYMSDLGSGKIFKYNITLRKFEIVGYNFFSPNGILYDPGNNRLIIVSFREDSPIQILDLKTKTNSIAVSSAGDYLDGICYGKDGYFFYSAWGKNADATSGKIFKIRNDFKEPPILVEDSLNSPADIIYNFYNDTLAIPAMMESKIRFINFSTPTPPGTPNIIFPENDAFGLNQYLEFSWTRTTKAESYKAQISFNPEFTNLLIDTTLSKTTFEYLLPLPGKMYFWRVKALNFAGESDWSDIALFTTKESVFEGPVLIKPVDMKGGVELYTQFVWSSSLLPIYKIEVAEDEFFQKVIAKAQDITDTFFILPAPLNNGTVYSWRIKSYSGSLESEWSHPFKFRTKNFNSSQTVLDAPENASDSVPQKPILKWKSLGASFYEVHVALDPFFKNTIFKDESIDTIQYFNKKLSPYTKHYWKVRAFFDVDDAEWSEIWSFTTGKDTVVSADSDFLSSLTLYPNPAKDKLIVSGIPASCTNLNLKLNSCEGFCILFKNGVLVSNGNLYLDLPELSSGAYFLQLFNSEATFVKKVIVLD